MQRPTSYSAVAFFAGLYFLVMAMTALNTGDLVVRTFACICALASILAAEATYHVRTNAVKSVAVWSITSVVFGVSILFYARAYPLEASIVGIANASVAAAVVLAVVAWRLRKIGPAARHASQNANATN